MFSTYMSKLSKAAYRNVSTIKLRSNGQQDDDNNNNNAQLDAKTFASGIVLAVILLAALGLQVWATARFVNRRLMCATGIAFWLGLAVVVLSWSAVPVASSVAWVLLMLGAFTCMQMKVFGGNCGPCK